MSIALSAILIIFVVVLLNGCRPEEPPIPIDNTTVPTISTVSVTDVTLNSAIVSADISADGGADITEAGICWREGSVPPTAESNLVKTTVNFGAFSVEINKFLEPKTKYIVRAYAKNKKGVAYGDTLSFITEPITPKPAVVSTDAIVSFGTDNAVVRGTIISNGGWEITEAGICWCTSNEPTIADHVISVSKEIGTFEVSINGLDLISDYHVRTYATNAAGTVYGDELPFTTLDSVVDADGNSYYGVKIGNQVWLTANLKVTHFNNGEEIPYVTDNTAWSSLSSSGYCWFNNDESRKDGQVGALYNWWVGVDPRGVAPIGYHIPSATELKTLGDYYGIDSIFTIPEGEQDAGENYAFKYYGGMAIRSTEMWNPTIVRGNNSSGFNALPSGFRFYANGNYNGRLNWASWWTTTEYSTSCGWNMYTGGEMINDSFVVTGKWCGKKDGDGLRCIKD
jgi:uncharacterized protein (TIGR02145 family)